MQPFLLTTQLVDEGGARITQLVVVPVKRGTPSPGAFNINLALAHTGHVLRLLMPPTDCTLQPGGIVETTRGIAQAPHITHWNHQTALDAWETIMASCNFISVQNNAMGKGLFQASLFAGLVSGDSDLNSVDLTSVEQWISPAGRLAWLVALGAHLPTPAAADLRIKAAMNALKKDQTCAELRPELMEYAGRRCADRLAAIIDEWTRWTGRQQLREREPVAAAADVVTRLIELMERVGKVGKEQGKHARAALKACSADELMLRRVDDVSFDAPLMTSLIIALWHDEIRERLTHQPAVVRAVVAETLAPIRAQQVELLDDGSVRDGHRVIARVVPALDAQTAGRIASNESLHLLGRVAGHRFINHLVKTAYRQMERGEQDFRTIIFDGAFHGLREVVKQKNNDDKDLKELLEIGPSFRFESESIDIGGLWMWTHTKPAPGRRAQITVMVGQALLPSFHELINGRGLAARQARHLIPLLDHEPPLECLRRNDHGAALNLSQLALVELRDAAQELERNGWIRTPLSRWRELARRAGLPLDALETLLAGWERPGEGETAFIERCGDEWTLASPHALQLEFIREAGAQSIQSAANGRAAKRKKARHGAEAHSGRLI